MGACHSDVIEVHTTTVHIVVSAEPNDDIDSFSVDPHEALAKVLRERARDEHTRVMKKINNT